MTRTIELPRYQLPVPTQDRIRCGHGSDFTERLPAQPIGKVARSGFVSWNRDGNFARRIRFSAARYSFRRSNSWLTEPVM